MRYFLAFIFLLNLLCITANARAYNYAPALALPKHLSSDTDTVFRKSSIIVGANYGSDIQFFGRTGPINYPYASTNAIYNFRTGFFVYGSAVRVLGYNPFLDEIDLGTGYLFRISKVFSGSISYTRFLFNKDAAYVIKSPSTNDINFKNSFDWKIAKSSVVFDYLFGKENDYFITLNTSKYIETDWSIFDDKDFLSFNPTISAIFGTQNFVGSYSSQYRFSFDIDDVYVPGPGGHLPPIKYNNGRFNALNYSIKLPVAYNRPHYTLEAAWKYSIPDNVEGQLKNKHEVFFYLTFYYVFF